MSVSATKDAEAAAAAAEGDKWWSTSPPCGERHLALRCYRWLLLSCWYVVLVESVQSGLTIVGRLTQVLHSAVQRTRSHALPTVFSVRTIVTTHNS